MHSRSQLWFRPALLLLVSPPLWAFELPPSTQPARAEEEERLKRQVLDNIESDTIAAKRALTDLQTAIIAFMKLQNDLLTNDTGKRIALDPLALMQFAYAKERPITPLEDVTRRLEIVNPALTRVQAKLGRTFVGELPAPQSRDEVAEAWSWARSRADRLTEQSDALKSLIAAAPKDQDLSKAQTLEDAVKDFRQRFARVMNENWKRGEESGQERASRVMAETGQKVRETSGDQEARIRLERALAENERLKADHEIELRRLREDKDRVIADQDRQLTLERNARLQKEAETRALAGQGQDKVANLDRQARCRSAETKNLLAPFITPGRCQPSGYACSGAMIDRGPISLSALSTFGALAESVEGVEALIAVASCVEDKERPRWGLVANVPVVAIDNPKGLDKARAAHRRLIELGDTLVELKMLAP